MTAKSSLKGKLFLLLISTFISLLLAEMGIRLLISDATFEDKFLMWNSPHFRLDQNGAVRYLPRESIREVAVYNGQIEYDLRYETNNMGFIDHVDYLEQTASDTIKNHIAFVGDSFLAGSGGVRPWVPELRDRIRKRHRDTQIYNLGVVGAGIEHFRRLLSSVAEEIPFDEIIIFAISNDFTRPFWRPLTTSEEIRFCPMNEAEHVCAKRSPIATIFNANSGENEILERATELRTERFAASQQSEKRGTDGAPPYLLRNSRLFMLLYNLYHENPLVAAGEKRQQVSDALMYFAKKENFKAFEEIRSQFPDIPIRLVHFPEKHEVRSGRYDLDLEDNARRLGIEYFPALERCDWSVDMYHPNDPHPNPHGYANITTCVENYLFPAESG